MAITPLGPTQNSRYWGIGNQLETLLLAPLLAGAALARRLFGAAGFAAFALLGLVTVAGNKFGSDGGGAIVLGVAFAFLGARLLRLGARGFVTMLLAAATAVMAIVWHRPPLAGAGSSAQRVRARALRADRGGGEPRAALLRARRCTPGRSCCRSRSRSS